ncbi:MAG TPA: ABC transporter permease [Candidatus Acidoferrales bacterium]|nr:ABC transporter permease [Candidatus Acidoferrales bacterium]
MLKTLVQDLRYGARQLRSNPAFAAVAVLSLALGVGANTAIFQLVDAVRLRSLPVKNPEQLVTIDFAKNSSRSGSWSTRSARFTSVLWDQLHALTEPFSGMIAWSATRFNLAQGGEARYAEGQYVSGDFFPVLGVPPAIGRSLTPGDDQEGCSTPGAVLSYAFWQREMAGDERALGKDLLLDGSRFTVIGVMPPQFFGVEVGNRFDVAVPLCADQRKRAKSRTQWWLSAMGRLRPGWTEKRTATYIQSVSPRIMEATLPESYRPAQAKRYLANKLAIESAATGVSGLRQQYESPLSLLLAATGLVLLIACANLANLLMARASVREREIAVRQAIGASRGRLVAQLLSESLLLALLGTALGVGLAQALSRVLISFLSTPQNPVFVGLLPDLRMLGFTAAVAAGTCLLFGLLPAVRATGIAPAAAMRAAGRGLSAGRERYGLRRALVTAQVALSLVLLVGALLFVRSLQKLLSVDPGFRPEGIVALDVDTRPAKFPKERRPGVFREVQEKLSAVPGVVSVAQVNMTPISGSGWNESVRPDAFTGEAKNSFFNRYSPGYLKTMGTRLIAGRDFDERDTVGAPKVAVVNEVFAKKFFDGANPVGHTFRVEGSAGQQDRVYQIIGLISNTKYYELREDFIPIAFFPVAQDENPDSDALLVLRTAGRPQDVIRSVKSAMAAMNPAYVLEFRIMTTQIEESLMRDRLMAALAGAFGVLAAVLAAIGLYGVIAYMVARRQNEIGVRMALGADRGNVVRLVLREALLLLGVGLAVGTGLALWAGQAATKLLFGLAPNDPATFAAAAVLLGAVAVTAGFVPARRASRMDPMEALRVE